jgi:hypothetical protein
MWMVREVDTTRVPGARADRCLIFESDSVVRRVWVFPATWESLGDRDLGALLRGDGLPHPTLGARSGTHPAMVVAGLALMRAEEIQRCAWEALEANRGLRAQREMLLEACSAERATMLAAVRDYVRELKSTGVEQGPAMKLIASAIEDALPAMNMPVEWSKALMAEGLQIGRDIYLAA